MEMVQTLSFFQELGEWVYNREFALQNPNIYIRGWCVNNLGNQFEENIADLNYLAHSFSLHKDYKYIRKSNLLNEMKSFHDF